MFVTGDRMRFVTAGKATALALAGVIWAGGAQAQTAAEECRAIAGVPTAEAPVSRDALNEYFSTLARARPHCEAAAIGAEPDADALFHLAVIMQREGAHNRALAVFELAAEAGVAAAHTKLGDYFNFGIGGTREDITRAVAEYEKAIAGGDVAAKSTMAVMHQLGRGVPRDPEKTLSLTQASADAGYHFAQFRLAELYMDPRPLPQDVVTRLNLPDPIKAAELYEKAAAQGSVEARAKVKDMYDGVGAFADPQVKFKLIQSAADRGEAQAINSLGFLYETGQGVDYDPIEAATLYIRALETGDLPVDQLRGRINGRTPPWDRETALEFQRILQERGFYRGALDAQVGPGTLGAARQLIAAQ
jgi:TPR repeat protein